MTDPRILHLAETAMGGIAAYLQEVIPYQVGVLGTDNVHILVPSSNTDQLLGIDKKIVSTFEKNTKKLNVSEQRGRTGRSVASVISFFISLRRCIKTFRPTIVHIHSSFGGVLARPFVAMIYPRIGVIYCPHGWAFQMEVSERKKNIFAIIERMLYHFSDVIINISYYEKSLSRKYGIPPSKCVVVRNGIALRDVTASNSVQMDASCINLLFVGRFSREKGLDLLLKVMQRIIDIPIKLYAVGCTVEPIDVPPNVTVIKWLPRESIDAYYAAADAVVVPSRCEGFCIVAIEATRAGRAIISSNRCSLPEIVKHGVNGYLVDIDDPDLIGMEQILRGLDKVTLREMGTMARHKFENEFTSDKMNRSLIDIYKELQSKIN